MARSPRDAAALAPPAEVSAQGQSRSGSCSASRRSASTCWPRSPARRSSASMSTLPDMLYGTVKMSPRFWAKPVKADLVQGRKDARRDQDRADRNELWPRLRRHRRKHLGGVQGGRSDRRRMGRARISAGQRRHFRRAEAGARRRRLGDARRWRRRHGLRRRAARKDRRGRLCGALSRACDDGADERHGAAEGRRARHLVRQPGADLGAAALRQCGRHRTGQGQRPHHLPGRRLRSARRGGLCAVRRADGEGNRRPAGQGDLDARGGHAPRRLPAGCRRQIPGAAWRRRPAGRSRHEDRLAIDDSQHLAPAVSLDIAARARQVHRRRRLRPALHDPELPGDRHCGTRHHPGRLVAIGRQFDQRLLPRRVSRRDRRRRQDRSGRTAQDS